MHLEIEFSEASQRLEVDALNELPNFADNLLPIFPFKHFMQSLRQQPVNLRGRRVRHDHARRLDGRQLPLKLDLPGLQT